MGLGSYSVPVRQYSQAISGEEKPGETPIYVSPLAKPYLYTPLESGATTLYQNFQVSVKNFGEKPFLGTRRLKNDGSYGEYIWKTYNEVSELSLKIGSGFHALGLTEKNAENLSILGIYAKTSEEWIITDLAAMSQNITIAPIYEVQQPDTIRFIINQTEMKAVVCSMSQFERLMSIKADGSLPTLKIIIVFPEVTEELKSRGASIGVDIFSLLEVANISQETVESPPKQSDVYTICYTSGTTGRSKGAVLTHSNVIATIAGISACGFLFNSNDSHLSYLPLAHMLERLISQIIIYYGASVGFYSGDVNNIKDDLSALKPTIFVSVPRLYNRFYDLMIQQFNNMTGIKKIIADRALAWKMSSYHTDGSLNNRFWDTLVFNKIRNNLGGRVRFMVTGSAPISGEVLSFLRVAFACPIVEGYGQTESCAGSMVTHPSDNECGHVGGPLPSLEVKLVDVPDMKYLSTDTDETGTLAPRGEICIRGLTVFKGYYKEPEHTSEAIDSEGWLHTGDIATRLPHNGAFKIIDRIKNFFKLAQGEYVAVEKIELMYNKSKFISQIFVYGDSFQSFLVGVVVPEEGYIRNEWAGEHGISPDMPFDAICRKRELKNDILEDMKRISNEAGLFGYEQVKKIHLEPIPWSTDDLITPTQKLMHFKAKLKYQDVIAELYS